MRLNPPAFCSEPSGGHCPKQSSWKSLFVAEACLTVELFQASGHTLPICKTDCSPQSKQRHEIETDSTWGTFLKGVYFLFTQKQMFKHLLRHCEIFSDWTFSSCSITRKAHVYQSRGKLYVKTGNLVKSLHISTTAGTMLARAFICLIANTFGCVTI